jgi:hypothetical protein
LHWQDDVGDCRQELVFIGQHLDIAQLHAELDACLLDDHEMQAGESVWMTWPDPFAPWQ